MDDLTIAYIVTTWGITNSFLIVIYMNNINKLLNKNVSMYNDNINAIILCTFASALSAYDIYNCKN